MAETQAEKPAAIRRVRLRHHCGYKANLFMLRAGGLLLPVGYGLVAAAACWFWLTDGPSRRASRGFLTRAASRGRRSAAWWQTLYHMYIYGQLLLDRSVSLADDKGRFKVASATGDSWREGLNPQRGLLMLTAHFGAAELSAVMLKRVGPNRRANFVVYRDMRDATEHFHRDQWKLLADIQWINSMEPVAAGLKVMAALKRREVVAMRADRPMQGRTVTVEFLGRRMQLPAGPFIAAVLSGADVVSAFTVRSGYRCYDMHISMPRFYISVAEGDRDRLAEQAVKDYTADLEATERNYPYQWGNFYDVWASCAEDGSPHES